MIDPDQNKISVRDAAVFLAVIVLTLGQFRWSVPSLFVPVVRLLMLWGWMSRKSALPALGIAGWWFQATTLLFLVRVGEGKTLRSVGLARPTLRTLLGGVALWIFFLASWRWTYLAARMISSGFSAAPTVASLSLAASAQDGPDPVMDLSFLLNAVSVVFYEETLRGYLVERLASFTRRLWTAAFVVSVFIVLLHVPGRDLEQVLQRVPITLVMTFFFAWQRDIVACMIPHLLINVEYVRFERVYRQLLWSPNDNALMWVLFLVLTWAYVIYTEPRPKPR